MRRHLRRAKATIKYTPSFESSCPDPGCKPYNTKAAIAKVRVDPRLSDKEKRYRVNKLISNKQYLLSNGKVILKNAKKSDDFNQYLNKTFNRYEDTFDNYPGTLEKPNKSFWMSYFKKRF